MLRLLFIVRCPCRLSLCEQTNEIKRNLLDTNKNINVLSKNKRKKEEKHPSHLLSNLSLPMTTVVLVGEAFQISLHMNTYNNQDKEVKYMYLENGMKIQKFPLPPHQHQMSFVQY